MRRRGQKSETYRTEILQMVICTDDESKVKYTKLKQCNCQYAETRKESQIYRTKIMEMPICREKESKVKYTELKYCRCQYAEIRKPKSNIKN